MYTTYIYFCSKLETHQNMSRYAELVEDHFYLKFYITINCLANLKNS